MIQEFVKCWDQRKGEIEAKFRVKHPDDYEEIVRAVVEILGDGDSYRKPDPTRIHSIDDGHYQGTLVFVIGADGYQPDDYWFVKVGYGSCSGCDTLEAISGYSDEPPTDEQVSQYMTLALHILQGLKEMKEEPV
jgi:hypothetical protein